MHGESNLARISSKNKATANALRSNLKHQNQNDDCSSIRTRLCNKCGQGESCVLLLSWRHLRLCTGCASFVNTCPICRSIKNISINFNMS
ncbi:putative transcription factor C2H2 family [Helianthus annuus]|nr:putative transcription factor C2H2 family [Helianthus annuus]